MRNKQAKMILIMSMVLLSSALAAKTLIGTSSGAIRKKNIPDSHVLIFSNTTTSALTVSLGLDDKIHYMVYANGDNNSADLYALDFDNIDVIIFDSFIPINETDRDYVKANINGTLSKTGVIFFGGNYTEQALLQMESLLPIQFVIYKERLRETMIDFFNDQTGLVGNPSNEYLEYIYNNTETYEIKHTEMQVAVSDEEARLPASEKSIYSKRIAWTSCPLLYSRIFTYNKKLTARTLVEYPTTKEPLVVTWNYTDDPNIQIIYVSPGTQELYEYKDGKYELRKWNEGFKYWPYFNYFLYLMIYDIKGLDADQIETYAEWPWSPIPHEAEAAAWMTFVGFLWVFNFVLFFTLGKKKKNRNAEAKMESETAKESTNNASESQSEINADKESES